MHLCLSNLGIAIHCGTLQHIPAQGASLYFNNCAPRRRMSSGNTRYVFLSLGYSVSLQSYGHCYVAISLHLSVLLTFGSLPDSGGHAATGSGIPETYIVLHAVICRLC